MRFILYTQAMPTTGNHTFDLILAGAAAVILLFLGYRVGYFFGTLAASRAIAMKEQELFTAQKGFKNLYEQEVSVLKTENEQLKTKIQTLDTRVEEYRKKAAGFGGLFNAGSKRADAMYALLLENEALEEALHAQNSKLQQERTDSLKEQMRSTGYRRVLISQLMNDERIKGYVAEIMADEKRLPSMPDSEQKSLPAATESSEQTGG